MNTLFYGNSGLKLALKEGQADEQLIQRIKGGQYEWAEVKMAIAAIRENDRVLELGAGIGLISIVARKRCFPEFYACFEANPELIECIRYNHELNDVKDIEVVNALLTSDDSELAKKSVSFKVTDNFWMSSVHAEEGRPVQVPAMDAHAYIQKHAVNTLICDIEGHELDLFLHLDLSSLEKIIIELHPAIYGCWGVNKINAILRSFSFEKDVLSSFPSAGCFVYRKRY